jgi:hypothetical protein
MVDRISASIIRFLDKRQDNPLSLKLYDKREKLRVWFRESLGGDKSILNH